MRWFKVAAIAAGVLIAWLVVSSVIGFLIEAAMAALFVAVIVLAVKVVYYRNQVSRKGPDREVGESWYTGSLPRHDMRDVDDELTRLKREMGG